MSLFPFFTKSSPSTYISWLTRTNLTTTIFYPFLLLSMHATCSTPLILVISDDVSVYKLWTFRSRNNELCHVPILRKPTSTGLVLLPRLFRNQTTESCTKNLARSHRPPKSHQGLNISHQVQPDRKELKRSLSSIIQAVFESLIFTQMTIIIISIRWHLTKRDDKIIDNHVRYILRRMWRHSDNNEVRPEYQGQSRAFWETGRFVQSRVGTF